MGRHASAERRRSVAAWPIIVGVVVLVLVVATVGYFQLTKGDKNTAACGGTTVLPVVVATGAAPAVERAAQAFNATKPEARSTCVSVSVTTVPGRAAVTALAAGWRDQRSPAPGLWIADSTADVAALDASNPALTAGHPNQGLASSPVVLAVRRATGSTPVSWASLAAGSGGVVLGIGDPAVDRAAAAVLQSLVRGASGNPADGAAIDTAAVATAGPALSRLAAGSSTVPASTDLALTELASGKSRYTAVPVLESELATFNGAKGNTLTAVYPTGPTAAAVLMPIPLTATWVTSAMSDAAAAFDGYLGDAAGTSILTAAHLRTSSTPVAADGVDLRTPVTVLPDASSATTSALAAAWKAARADAGTASTAPSGTTTVGTAAGATAPNQVSASASSSTTQAATTAPAPTSPTTTAVASTSNAVAPGPAITLLVDTSGSMSTVNNGAQRLTWVKSAIGAVVQKSPHNSFGLSSFATTTSTLVPLGPLDQPVNGAPRSTAIVDAVNQLTPSGNSYTYRAIGTVLADAANDAVPGVHRLVLLTDGSDSTPGLSRDSVKATVAALVAQHPGLTLDIIGLSTSVNEQALTEIAAAGGGTFTPVNTLTDLEPALLALSS